MVVMLSNARTAIRRTKNPKVSARSLIYVGLRGVGKTVLLNEIQHYADSQNCITDLIEASCRLAANYETGKTSIKILYVNLRLDPPQSQINVISETGICRSRMFLFFRSIMDRPVLLPNI